MHLYLLILTLLLFSCNNSIEPIDCAGVPGGNAVEDICGICNGDGIVDGACDCAGNIYDVCGICGGESIFEDECSDTSCDSEICISIINVNLEDNSMDIWMINSVSVAGFQFEITGITIITSSGGLAEGNGFSISSSSSIILGFSFGGAEIPFNSNGVLINVTFSDITDNICIENPIFSGTSGNGLIIGPINCFLLDS